MKLPKPGNVKLPKPGKVKLPKPGKMPGNLKLPAFHMKSGFLKKNLLTLIAAAVLVIGTGTAYGTLATREADRGFDPVEGVNQDRYQVLVSGEGYKLSKIQERNYKLQKKQNEVNAAQAAQNAMNNPTTIRTSSGYRTYRTSNYRYRYRGSRSYSTSGTVFISTNIYSQKNTKMNWRAGDEFSFIVTAYTYKNGKKNTVSKDNIKVTSDKGTLKHTGSKDGNQYYVLKLGEGINKITVTAKDKNSKKKSKYSYTITAGKKASSSQKPKPDNQDKPKPETEDKAKVNIGFGLNSQEIVITGETRSIDVLSKTKGVGVNTDSEEVEYVTGDMSGLTFEKCFKNYDAEKDNLKQICEEEKQEEINSDKEEHENDIIDALKSAYSDKPEEEMTEDEKDGLKQYIEDNFDEYYMDHYFEAIYNEWLGSIKSEIKDKYFKKNTKIKTGDTFHGYTFRWVYDDVKGEKVKTNINLRLILER